MLLKNTLISLYLLLIPMIGLANETLPDFFEVSYTLYSNDMKIGLMERRFFAEENGDYTFRSETRTTGFISLFRKDHVIEQSRWKFVDADFNFKPLLYTYQRTGGKKDRLAEIRFNWSKNQVRSAA